MTKDKFVLADAIVSDSLGKKHIVMLSDLGFWIDHYDELKQWCGRHDAAIQGMTVDLHSDSALTAFLLKWQ